MLFYKIEMESERALENNERKWRRIRARIKEQTEETNEKFKGHASYFVSDIQDRRIFIGAAVFVEAGTMDKRNLMAGLAHFCVRSELRTKLIAVDEITVREFSRMLLIASRRDYIDDDDKYKSELDMDFIDGLRCGECREILIPNYFTKRQALAEARRLLCGASFRPELERIFDPRAPREFVGNPVHYVVASDDSLVRVAMRELLLGALIQKRRLAGKRCCILDLNPNNGYSIRGLYDIYQSQKGCALVLSLTGEDEEEQSHVNASCEFIANVASNIIEFRRDTLTILEMKRSEERLYQRLMEELPNVMFVRLEEEITFKREAKTYLRRLAMKNGIKNCSSLLGCLAPSDSGYLSSDLNKLFDKWYDEYLRTELHVQYRELTSGQKKIQSKPKGDAYRDLMEMVGLQPVKKVILQAVEFHKAQKLFSGRGITAARPAMHMVFAGNPGTAKTTVARLMARIMKDNGLLSVGGLVEVGRGDLVGKYVGWTAQIVKKKFKEARGSVLFIDEAYSLVEDRGGLYGDEAINTIVQEMENARDDTVVVFAGYPDRMKEFVKRNPGLRSRVAFHIDFPDYTVDELLEIFTLILKNRGHHAAPTALERARCLMEEALGTPDFGNGRFVRNMAEQAEMRQAARLLHLPPDTVTDEDIRTFIPEDLGMPEHPEGARCRVIGFA